MDEELTALMKEIRELRRRVAELETLRNTMYNQLGGGGDPREDPDHPGHMLLRLGWRYCPDDPDSEPDYYGCFWSDPKTPRGKVEIVSLNEALGRALRRMFPTRLDRLLED